MADRDVFIIAKKFHDQGSLAYRCKSPEEIREFPKIIKQIQSPGVQLVMLNAPELYAEYEPYTYIEEKEEFIQCVLRMRNIISS